MTISKDSWDELISFAMKRTDAKLQHYLEIGRVRPSEEDDLRQDVMLYVLKKLPEYDPNLGIDERTYLKTLIKNAFRSCFSKSQLMKNEEWRDIDTLTEMEEPEARSSSEMSELDHIYLKLDLATVREKLAPELQEVYDLLGTHSPATIASMLQITKAAVGKRIERIQTFVQKYFPELVQ